MTNFTIKSHIIYNRFFEGVGHFNIFSDPLEITRYFESQIENKMMNFIYGFNNEGMYI